jgi:Tol biopolymer transport system component
VANADGSAEREIAARQHPDKFSFCAASWSPNGELVALGASRYSDTEFAILGVPVRGGYPVELSQWQWKYMAAVAWKGNNLYFSAMAANSNSFQIWRLSCLGGQPQRITNDPNNYEQISVAKKSPTLVTMLADVHTNLWLAPVSTGPGVSVGTLARRITSGKTEGFAGLAAAANCIVYASTEHQQSDLWKVNAEGSDRTRLTHGGGFFPSVSRDCRTIAYVSAQGGTHHIWHMDGDGGNQKQLTNGGGEGFPSISKDGRWVVYTSLSKERNTLWKIATEDGKTAQLTRNSLAIKPVVSPDGQCVACAYRRDEADQWKIGVLPIEGGEPLQTFALPNPYNQIIRWTADGRALTFLAKHDGVHNVWKQPLDGSAPIKLTNFTEDLIYHYDWLSDERLIVSRGMKTRDIVLIRNFE